MRGSAMPSYCVQKSIQCAAHDCSHGQTTAPGVLPQPFYRGLRNFQRNRHGDFGNFHWTIEVGSLFQVTVGLTL